MELDDIGLTDGEKKYIESGGKDDSDLVKELGIDTPSGGQEQQQDLESQQPDPEQLDHDEDGSDDHEEQARKDHVPHGRYHKERVRRQEAEKQLQDMQLKMARAEERMNILNEFMNSQNQQQGQQEQQTSVFDEDPIDPVQDILGAHEQQQRQIKALLDQLGNESKTRETYQNEQQQTHRQSQIKEAYITDARRFAASEPNFPNAYAHLVQNYHAELEAMGVTDINERNQRIVQEEQRLAEHAFQQGKSPAEVIFSLARSRGFQAGQSGGNTDDLNGHQEDELEDNSAQGQQYQQPAQQPRQQQNSQASAILNNVKKGQQNASASLSNAGGATKNGMTFEQMLNMDDSEFFEKVHKLKPTDRRKFLASLR